MIRGNLYRGVACAVAMSVVAQALAQIKTDGSMHPSKQVHSFSGMNSSIPASIGSATRG